MTEKSENGKYRVESSEKGISYQAVFQCALELDRITEHEHAIFGSQNLIGLHTEEQDNMATQKSQKKTKTKKTEQPEKTKTWNHEQIRQIRTISGLGHVHTKGRTDLSDRKGAR